MKSQTFEHSIELKRAFNELSEQWCRKNRMGMADLAERCGVSVQYLQHIGRYGRIPSRPVLTLLAFVLEVADPQVFFRLAGLKEDWPFEPGLGLRQQSAADSGLLSVSIDKNGFASMIREIVRAEVQPKRVEDLLGNRALRVGLNRGQFFLFDSGSKNEGFFPELMRALALALHCQVEFTDVAHGDFATMLERGKIDCYGPVYRTASRLGKGLFSRPFCAVNLAALGRLRKATSLSALPMPKRISDLRKRDYVIAVHRDSMAQHFAESELDIPAERLIACDLPEEAFERVLLANLPRPAHLMLTDAPYAERVQRQHSSTTQLLFCDNDSDCPQFEDTFVVRSDWPSLLALMDQALELLKKGKGLERLFERSLPAGGVSGVRI